MTRGLLLSLLVSVIVGSGSGAAQGGQPPVSTSPWGGGVLVSVDEAAKAILVRQGQHEQRYQLADDARMRDGKATLTIADLPKGVGRYVRIRFSRDGEHRVANRVDVLDRKGSTATASQTPAGSGGEKTPQ